MATIHLPAGKASFPNAAATAPAPRFSGKVPFFPVAEKHSVWKYRNWPRLFWIAYMNRLLTGLGRVFETHPKRVRDDRPLEEKRLRFWERIYVEIIGIILFSTALYTVTDLAAKAFEKHLPKPFIDSKNLPPDANRILNDILQDVGMRDFIQQANEDMVRIFCDAEGNPRLYNMFLNQASLNTLKQGLVKMYQGKLGIRAFEEAWNVIIRLPQLQQFASRYNLFMTASLFIGALASSFVGGAFIQWTNDRVLAPLVKPIIRYFSKKEPPPRTYTIGAFPQVLSYADKPSGLKREEKPPLRSWEEPRQFQGALSGFNPAAMAPPAFMPVSYAGGPAW